MVKCVASLQIPMSLNYTSHYYVMNFVCINKQLALGIDRIVFVACPSTLYGMSPTNDVLNIVSWALTSSQFGWERSVRLLSENSSVLSSMLKRSECNTKLRAISKRTISSDTASFFHMETRKDNIKLE